MSSILSFELIHISDLNCCTQQKLPYQIHVPESRETYGNVFTFMFFLKWCKDIYLGFWDIEITQWKDSVILLFTHDGWLLRNTLSTVLCFLDYIIKSKSLVANIKINITISNYCECNFFIKVNIKNWIWSNDGVGIRSNFCYLNYHHKSVIGHSM